MDKKPLLSPDFIPNAKPKTGVRRVNNIPLIIAVGAVTLFVVLIALVAVKRANQQKQPILVNEPKKAEDSFHFAKAIIAGHASGIIEPIKPTPLEKQELALPVAVLEHPDLPPKPSPDESILQGDNLKSEQLLQDKFQQFEEAVKAKTKIEITQQLTRHEETSHQTSVMSPQDTTAEFQAALKPIQSLLAEKGQANVTPQTLGGHEDEKRWQLHAQIQAPKPFELRAGSIIPGVMISGIRSDLPGQIIAQVKEHVFDTATGKYLLIPQGTRLYGLYSSEVHYGQNSVLIAWQRLIFPDGKALDLGSMPGSDSAGFAGFRDQVNHHYFRIFGSAFLMSGIVAGVTVSQNQNGVNSGLNSPPTAGAALSQALGQQLGEVTTHMIEKNLDIAPSLDIRSGYRFNVMVTKDLVFKTPYKAFDY